MARPVTPTEEQIIENLNVPDVFQSYSPALYQNLGLGVVPGAGSFAMRGFRSSVSPGDGITPLQEGFGGALPTVAPAATTVSIVSDDAADTGNVDIDGVDGAGLRFIESLPLNGTTPVITTSMFKCINSVRYNDGSIGRNVGTITGSNPATDPYNGFIIDPAAGESRIVVFTVPLGMTATATSVITGGAQGTAESVAFIGLYDPEVGSPTMVGPYLITTGSTQVVDPVPRRLSEGSEVFLAGAVVSGANDSLYWSMQFAIFASGESGAASAARWE